MGLKTRLLASGKTEDNEFNISLLGFKIAVNEGLTVFNLVDGVVDEFHDESGTDEGEGSNDRYVADSDYYINSNTNTGVSVAGLSAGFSTTAITEPQTSTTATNPQYGTGTFGTFTVPAGITSVTLKAWAAGGGGTKNYGSGGAGGFSSGNYAVTAGQVLDIVVGEGAGPGEGAEGPQPYDRITLGGGGEGSTTGPLNPNTGGGGGGSFITAGPVEVSHPQFVPGPSNTFPTSGFAIAAGGGGGAAGSCSNTVFTIGGGGGGLQGDRGQSSCEGATSESAEQTSKGQATPGKSPNGYAGGGSQTAGGQGGSTPGGEAASGGFMYGGIANCATAVMAGGGGGFYGGGVGTDQGSQHGGAGGGSGYIGNPQISSGATEEAAGLEGGGTADPAYVADTNESGQDGSHTNTNNVKGEDGYVLITSAAVCAAATSTTIVSEAFAAGTVPTISRIVVFEENVDSPTLNTDVIASISRDGGSNFTTATLTDSGYVTGSSGQRILTGQATISGQPSGQSMRWKLALANNQVKIHGVSLQWS